jgi:hypothetical protein
MRCIHVLLNSFDVNIKFLVGSGFHTLHPILEEQEGRNEGTPCPLEVLRTCHIDRTKFENSATWLEGTDPHILCHTTDLTIKFCPCHFLRRSQRFINYISYEILNSIYLMKTESAGMWKTGNGISADAVSRSEIDPIIVRIRCRGANQNTEVSRMRRRYIGVY